MLYAPICSSGDGGTLRTHRKGVYFCGVKPWDSEHAGTEGDVVEEEERDRSRGNSRAGGGVVRVAEKDSDDEEAEALASRGDQHQAAPTPALDERDEAARDDQVGCGVDTDKEPRQVVRQADVLDQDSREVVRPGCRRSVDARWYETSVHTHMMLIPSNCCMN